MSSQHFSITPPRRTILVRDSSRCGIVLMVALLCLLVVSLILAGMLRSLSLQTKQTKTGRWQLQSEWLANSALGKAAARLAVDAEYEGETWDLSADDLGANYPGRVKIEISPVKDAPSKRQTTVDAVFPVDPPQRARTVKSFLITMSEAE